MRDNMAEKPKNPQAAKVSPLWKNSCRIALLFASLLEYDMQSVAIRRVLFHEERR
jgi:hypothetical protein